MNGQPLGAMIGALTCVAASPYLARLTWTVPDREQASWWRGSWPVNAWRWGAAATVGVLAGGLAGWAAGWSALLPAFVALALVVTPLAIVDLEHHRLPDRLIGAGGVSAVLLLGLAAAVRHDAGLLGHAILGAAAVFAALFALAEASPRSFGFGDVKLGGLLGAYLGGFGWLSVFYGVFGGFLVATLVSLPLLLSRRATMKTAIPFGPALIAGALLVATISPL